MIILRGHFSHRGRRGYTFIIDDSHVISTCMASGATFSQIRQAIQPTLQTLFTAGRIVGTAGHIDPGRLRDQGQNPWDRPRYTCRRPCTSPINFRQPVFIHGNGPKGTNPGTVPKPRQHRYRPDPPKRTYWLPGSRAAIVFGQLAAFFLASRQISLAFEEQVQPPLPYLHP